MQEGLFDGLQPAKLFAAHMLKLFSHPWWALPCTNLRTAGAATTLGAFADSRPLHGILCSEYWLILEISFISRYPTVDMDLLSPPETVFHFVTP